MKYERAFYKDRVYAIVDIDTNERGTAVTLDNGTIDGLVLFDPSPTDLLLFNPPCSFWPECGHPDEQVV